MVRAQYPYSYRTRAQCNRLATVPTLVVPLANTLNPEIESRYKAIQDTKVIVVVHVCVYNQD